MVEVYKVFLRLFHVSVYGSRKVNVDGFISNMLSDK